MAFSVLEYRSEPKGVLKLIFAGSFFTRTPEAEFNRMLALSLFGEGVNVGILNRGPRDLDPATDGRLELLEQLEKNLPKDPDFCVCWRKENVGLSGLPVFRLVGETIAGEDEHTCSVVGLKPPGRSYQEAARVLKEQLEDLRRRVRRYKIPTVDFRACLFTGPTEPGFVEKTQLSLHFTGIKPRIISLRDVPNVDPGEWVLLVEEGESLYLEDREAFEKVYEAIFRDLEEKIVFLEAIPLDKWGLEHLIVPSVRFLCGRAARDLPPLDRMPLFPYGRWAPVRVLRPRFLAQKRRERLLKERAQGLPAYHYHHLLAVDAMVAEEPAEAIAAFQAAYQEAPEPYRALVLRNLCLTLLNQGRYEEVLEIIQDGKRLYPAYTDLWYLAGLVHWKQRCYDDALHEFLTAAEKSEATNWYYSDPGVGNYKPIFLAAEIYRKKGNFKGAIAAYIGSITYNAYFLPALERLGQMSLDSVAVAHKVLELLSQLLDLRQPEVKAALSRNLERYSEAFLFEFRGRKYHYFFHYYNRTWENERAVEIPIVWEIVKEFQGRRVLEVGNVLAHYFPVAHEILDKYEKAPGVLNKDVVEFIPAGKYDLIVSISTLKHVGWDEEQQEPEKVLRAVEVLKEALAPGGQMVVTLPVGYNPEMDKMLADGRLSFNECYGLKRISAANEWVEVPWQEVLGLEYGKPYPCANGLVVGIIEK